MPATTPRMLMNHTTAVASDVLAYALIKRPDLPVLGWEHYLTGMDDQGHGTFSYDNADAGCAITVTCLNGGHRLVEVK